MFQALILSARNGLSSFSERGEISHPYYFAEFGKPKVRGGFALAAHMGDRFPQTGLTARQVDFEG